MKVTVNIPAVVHGIAIGEYIIEQLPKEFNEWDAQEQAWYIEGHGNLISDTFEPVEYLDSSYYETEIVVEDE